MKRVLTAIVLLLISGVALASAQSGIPIGVHGLTAGNAAGNGTDVSITFLDQIFGTVGNVLQGTNGQMLGKMFDVFNKGVLVVAALWLGYTTITIALRSSHEGSFMGANKNVAYILIRIALGFALVMPNPSTGYSLMQDLVMKTVVEGVGLADQTWAAALGYIEGGGTLYVPPQSNKITGTAASNTLLRASQVFANEVCMLQSTRYSKALNKQSAGKGPNTGIANNGFGTTRQYQIIEDPKNNTITFPGYGSSYPNTNCGSILGVGGTGLTDAEKASSYQSMRQMVIDLIPAAKRWNCTTNSGVESCAGANQADKRAENESNMFSAMMGYINLVQPYARLQQNKANSQYRAFLSNAKKQGWIMAGRFYWDLARLNEAYGKVDVQNDMPQVIAPNSSALSGAVLNQSEGGSLNSLIASAKSDASGLYSRAAFGEMNHYQNTASSGTSGMSNDNKWSGHFDSRKDFHHWGERMLKTILGGIPKLISQFNHVNMDPILFLENIGQSSLAVAVKVWVAGLALVIGIGIGAGICNSESPGGVVWLGAVSWVKGFVMFVTGMLFIPGVILGYYVPLYPFLLFVFGAVGWLIIVIEAMAAAPLVAFGLTHPEGHDFLGKAEQGLMLFLSVFLRPVLMVIGLIAAMAVSYVALHFVNWGFASILHDIYSGGHGGFDHGNILTAASDAAWSSNDVLYLAIMPVILVFFTLVVYAVVQQSFSLVYELPNNIMQWIGGVGKQTSPQQMMQQVQGSMGNVANRAGQATGRAMASGAQMGSSAGYKGGARLDQKHNIMGKMSAKYKAAKNKFK